LRAPRPNPKTRGALACPSLPPPPTPAASRFPTRRNLSPRIPTLRAPPQPPLPPSVLACTTGLRHFLTPHSPRTARFQTPPPSPCAPASPAPGAAGTGPCRPRTSRSPPRRLAVETLQPASAHSPTPRPSNLPSSLLPTPARPQSPSHRCLHSGLWPFLLYVKLV